MEDYNENYNSYEEAEEQAIEKIRVIVKEWENKRRDNNTIPFDKDNIIMYPLTPDQCFKRNDLPSYNIKDIKNSQK